MDFIDELRQLATRAGTLREHLETEEATKHSLVMPFLKLLGYDVFNPTEVVPEFTVDVGTKKGEKVDYAIKINGQPAILVEAKPHTDPLAQYDSQLYRYFSTTTAKFAILTNGTVYKFYTDLKEPNKLDSAPFFEFDLLNIKEAAVAELKKFHREAFDIDSLFSTAADLKYTRRVIEIVAAEVKDPSEGFIRLFLRDVYPGNVTQRVLDEFKPLIKKALSQFISDQLNEMLQKALDSTKAPAQEVAAAAVVEPEAKAQVVTTAEELEGYYMVKFMLSDAVSMKRVGYKDTKVHLSIYIDGPRSWVCRLYFNEHPKVLAIVGKDKTENRVTLTDVGDLLKYRAELVAAAKNYVGQEG